MVIGFLHAEIFQRRPIVLWREWCLYFDSRAHSNKIDIKLNAFFDFFEPYRGFEAIDLNAILTISDVPFYAQMLSGIVNCFDLRHALRTLKEDGKHSARISIVSVPILDMSCLLENNEDI